MREDALNFRYFNRDGEWLDFAWSGLDLDADGTLRLHSLPGLTPEVDLPPAPAPAPSALAVAPDGSIVAIDPAGGGLVFIDACSGESRPVPLTPPIAHPSGVAISPAHRAVFVGDPDAGAVAAYDWTTWVQMLVWPGFQKPASLAADESGYLYVADPGAGRIDKFSPWGDRLPFGDNAQSSGVVVRPVAVSLAGGRVFVLDADEAAVTEFDADGNYLTVPAENLTDPVAMAAGDGVVYVAEAGVIDVYRRAHDGGWERAGSVEGFRGPVAGMFVDRGGTLLVNTGSPVSILRCQPGAAFAREGLLWSKALSASGRTVKWHRLELLAEQPSGTLLDVAVYLSNDPADPPVDPDAADPFPASWQRPGAGLTDFYLGDFPSAREARYLWIGIRWLGDALSTPSLSQIRAEFDHTGYMSDLPEIYREPPGPDVDFLTRFLALFEGGFEGIERKIEETIALLDPDAAPANGLEWLASFLALSLPAGATGARRRELIRNAFTRYARRGTPAAIRQAIWDETGIQAIIEEPIQQAAWWALPAAPTCPPGAPVFGGLLGVDTVLAAVEPQGAVLGSTAILDRSNLIAADQYGVPLFDELAHQFTVGIYRRDAAHPAKVASLAAVVEREKPAHTLARICVIEPRMRVGYQARLGIDTIVSGAPEPAPLGAGDLVLAGESPGHLDRNAEVGISTRL